MRSASAASVRPTPSCWRGITAATTPGAPRCSPPPPSAPTNA
jgi:hypothetical protein